ncbi:MAG: cyclodeaminase/cyclohydrolase family protein [Candidatus Omnitrophica bacterium]|nr:cyclodeaminase/cyclohydrolase family protein [Candidatus Omnitrophota bacterium]
MYSDESIKKYLNDLAARLPAPGGGSSAALAAAMASALISMVLNFSIGNEAYKNFEKTAKEILRKVEDLRNKFVKFFDDDIQAYESVSKAYKLPKDTEANKIRRKRAIKEAVKQAILVPLHVCQYSIEAIRLLPDLARNANKNLICDVEVPVRLLEAAFYSARINVIMNLKNIEDDEFKKDIANQLANLEKELIKYKETSEKEISKIVGG